MVTKEDIVKSIRDLGISEGDSVIVHSSFKSFGQVEGGAETVISAFEEVLTKKGILIFPTLVQKDFSMAYDTWHMDKPSDVGYLTEYFRKREGSYRSDQATHSVAASGDRAKWLVETHGHTHKRIGIFGDTPFSADSPWAKMYDINTKVVLIGVNETKITFKHYVEYMHIENALKSIEGAPEYEEMKAKVRRFGKPGVWVWLDSLKVFHDLDGRGLLKKTKCGDAEIISFPGREYTDIPLERFDSGDWFYLAYPEANGEYIEWIKEIKRIEERK